MKKANLFLLVQKDTNMVLGNAENEEKANLIISQSRCFGGKGAYKIFLSDACIRDIIKMHKEKKAKYV